MEQHKSASDIQRRREVSACQQFCLEERFPSVTSQRTGGDGESTMKSHMHPHKIKNIRFIP